MTAFHEGPRRVRVPATSANLGPGFDALGLALSHHDVLTCQVVDGPAGSVEIEVAGEGADAVPRDARHLVHRSLVRGLAAVGCAAPAVRLECHNAIPHGRGLGSSSAAIVGGLALARALAVDGDERLPDHDLLALAADIEGHPDNVAPAVLGGFTIAYGTADGFRAVRAEVDPGVRAVVFVPPTPLLTETARGLIPDQVPHADASYNVGRAALLVAALAGRPDLLLDATEDRLHQGYRASAMPESAGLIAALRAEGVAATVSGAGPTVLALLAPGQELDRTPPAGWRVWDLGVDLDGVSAL